MITKQQKEEVIKDIEDFLLKEIEKYKLLIKEKKLMSLDVPVYATKIGIDLLKEYKKQI